MEKQQILRQDKEIANPKLNRQSVKAVKEVQKKHRKKGIKGSTRKCNKTLGPQCKTLLTS